MASTSELYHWTGGRLEAFRFKCSNFKHWSLWRIDCSKPIRVIEAHVQDGNWKVEAHFYSTRIQRASGRSLSVCIPHVPV